MLTRHTFMGQYKKGKEKQARAFIGNINNKIEPLVKSRKLMTFSIYEYEEKVFLYYECCEKFVTPVQLMDGIEPYMETFAGEKELRIFVPLTDIFHYNRPISVEKWERPHKATPYGWILRLKPHMISSYIFYHYQFQEEQPAVGSKFGAIYLYENFMFFYLENPDYKEESEYEGKLSTNNTPRNWGEIMDSHFIHWDDGTLWKEIQLLYYCN